MVRTSVVSSVGLVLGSLFLGACSRNNIEAVNLAIEGDKAKGANLDEAISKYDQATKLDPDNHKIAWKLALAYHKKEDWAKDAAACGKAESAAESADKKKSFANYYFEHGYALEQVALATVTSKTPMGSGWADAKTPLQTAIQLDPNYAQGYEELGNLSLRLDDEAGALQNFTKAIETKPDELQYYPPLADLYIRLNFIEQAEQILKAGMGYGKEGDKHLFAMHALLAHIYDSKKNSGAAVTEYEAAKKACGKCEEHKEAYFLVGAAYAEADRKPEAIQNLQSFWKITCKGASAQKFADQCSQAQEIARRVGGALQ